MSYKTFPSKGHNKRLKQRYLWLIWLFSAFHPHQIFKHRSAGCCLQTCSFLVPTAVMARSFHLNPLKTKGSIKSISYSRGNYYKTFCKKGAPSFTVSRAVQFFEPAT